MSRIQDEMKINDEHFCTVGQGRADGLCFAMFGPRRERDASSSLPSRFPCIKPSRIFIFRAMIGYFAFHLLTKRHNCLSRSIPPCPLN